MSDTPRIYVACLSSYNAGTLHGAWIDCTDKSADEIQDEINAMLRKSPEPNVLVDCPENHSRPTAELQQWLASDCATCKGKGQVPSAEEWAIHDYEGFGGLKVGEHEGLEHIASAVAFIAEHGELGAKWLEHVGYGEVNEDASDRFQETYQGEWRSLEDWAENFLEDTGSLAEIPENLRYYFDFEKYANDCERSGDIFTIETGGMVHVFSNH